MELFDNLDTLLRTFWFIAIPSSLIFVIQTIMTFIGGDASDGTAADFDGDLDGEGAPFQLFSFRNLINFLIGFSWTGISFFETISNHSILIFISLLVGVFFVFIFFIIIRQVQKLAEDNSFKFTDTLLKTGEVYLPIPTNKTGKGKVLISVKGAVHELDAITEGDRIEVGTIVRVTQIESENLLIVQTI